MTYLPHGPDHPLAERFAGAGFALEFTGGNCYAFVRYDGDVVTVVCGSEAYAPDAPEDETELLFVATYTREAWKETGDPHYQEEDGIALDTFLERYNQ